VSEITKAQIRKAIEDDVIFGDGHTIYKPSVYTDHFDLPSHLIHTHRSGSHHKDTIYANDGSIIPELTGVYNLSFLEWLVGELGLQDRTQDFMGRGSIARDCVRVLTEWSNEDD